MKGLKELMESKGKPSKLDPMRKEANMGVLSELKKMASGMMGDDIKGLKKVTVAAPDQEGLKKGLNKAEDMLSEAPEASMPEAEEGADEVSELCEGKSAEEIDELIKQLEAKKAEMSV